MKNISILLLTVAMATFCGCGTEEGRSHQDPASHPSAERDAPSQLNEDHEKLPSSKGTDTPAATQEEPAARSAVQNAAAGYCDCFHANFKNIDPAIARILIIAGKSNHPKYVLQNELMKIADQEEQQKLWEEIIAFADDSQMQTCIQGVSRRYGLNEQDAQTLREVIRELDRNQRCEVIAALLKIAQQP